MSAPRLDPVRFDSAAFLRDYWQQRPLIIRNPWASWSNPVEPDELAGLACEATVESRLVIRTDDDWTLEQGPLAPERFGALGDDPWTLLVQAVDHHAPAVAALRAAFRFLPDWRIDDVMVSYATDRGGVGPHFDSYDVFLIQGHGRRRWQLGGPCTSETALLPHEDLRLLADFTVMEDHVLEPGDMLYVPPGIAHNGIALGDDCMTYSIGFRAPSRPELVEGWAMACSETIDEEDRYTDPPLQPPANPGEIGADALERLHGMMADALLDRQAFARWFGASSTAPKNPEIDWSPDAPWTLEDVVEALEDGAALVRNPASRFAFIREADGAAILFVDGESYLCSGSTAAYAERLCAGAATRDNDGAGLDPSLLSLIKTLLDRGSLGIDDEDA